jgi:hypothetical protein
MILNFNNTIFLGLQRLYGIIHFSLSPLFIHGGRSHKVPLGQLSLLIANHKVWGDMPLPEHGLVLGLSLWKLPVTVVEGLHLLNVAVYIGLTLFAND